MIRVMVVEDEPPIASSIKRLVEDCNASAQVVCTAINGKRALEYLENNQVDLVFSDIRMPIMDGLELAQNLHQRYPHIIMVIISGFQEFEFARKALRYGVSNYLLKPVSREGMAEVLEKACADIVQREEEEARQLVERAIRNEDAQSGDNTSRELCGVLLLCAGPWPLTPDEMLPSVNDLWGDVALEPFLKELMQQGETCISIGGRSLSEQAVVFSADSPDRILQVASAVYSHVTEQCAAAVTVVFHSDPVPLTLVGDAFNRLRKSLFREIRVFQSQMVQAGEKGPKEQADPGEQIKEVILALKKSREVDIQAALQKLIDHLCQAAVRQSELVVYLEKLVMNYFDGILNLQQIGEIKYDVQSAVSTSLTPEELAEELARVFYAWVRNDNWMEKGQMQDLCEAVADYIRTHYKSNITSAALSRQFGFSSTHLAKKFREYYGVSISEYVNNYRIELAQAMMRSDKKLMIKEIALEVGYNDQYYFSKIFKKLLGIWPTEYQR